MMAKMSSRGLLPRAKVAVAALAVIAALGVLTAAPAGAANTNIGGGEAHGTLTYADPGIPPAFAPCRAVDFTLDGGSEATLVINVQTDDPGVGFDGFAGTVELSGSGRGHCEGFSSGGGSLHIVIPETSGPNESTFGCASLRGGYTRAAADIEAIMGGTCSVNGNPVPVIFVFRGEFTANGGSGLNQPGLSGPITSASFNKTFVVMPA